MSKVQLIKLGKILGKVLIGVAVVALFFTTIPFFMNQTENQTPYTQSASVVFIIALIIGIIGSAMLIIASIPCPVCGANNWDELNLGDVDETGTVVYTTSVRDGVLETRRSTEYHDTNDYYLKCKKCGYTKKRR